MKVLFFLSTVLVMALAYSCEKDKVPVPIPLANSSCDTTDSISFHMDIQPILNANCVYCHNGPSYQFDFTSYASVIATIPSGALLGSIQHNPASGFLAMPLVYDTIGGQTNIYPIFIDSCSIKKIQKWINHGYPNN